MSPYWAFYIRLSMASCRYQMPEGCESSSLHVCISFYPSFDGCALHLSMFCSAALCVKWVQYKRTVYSLIFTVSLNVSWSRPWSPYSLRRVTAAVDSSHCAAAAVEIISLPAATLSPRCQLMPTVVHLQFALLQCCQQMLISPFSVLLILAYYSMPITLHTYPLFSDMPWM